MTHSEMKVFDLRSTVHFVSGEFSGYNGTILQSHRLVPGGPLYYTVAILISYDERSYTIRHEYNVPGRILENGVAPLSLRVFKTRPDQLSQPQRHADQL